MIVTDAETIFDFLLNRIVDRFLCHCTECREERKTQPKIVSFLIAEATIVDVRNNRN